MMKSHASFFKQSLFRALLFYGISNSVVAKPFECLIEPSQVVEIRASIEGLIEKINVDRGDTVKQGQVLILLDTGVDRARYEQAKFKASMRGAEMAAQSRLGFSTLKFDRNRQLFQDQYVSANDKDESEANKKLAAAQLQEARENNRVAELQVNEYDEIMRLKTLKSPFDGVVMERSHHPGEVAQMNDRLPLLKLARIDPLFVEVVLPAANLGKVHIGEEFIVKPIIDGGKEFKAKVKVIDPVVDAASGTFGLRLEVSNPNRQISAGINCQTELPGR